MSTTDKPPVMKLESPVGTIHWFAWRTGYTLRGARRLLAAGKVAPDCYWRTPGGQYRFTKDRVESWIRSLT